jgi:hypothetical protein
MRTAIGLLIAGIVFAFPGASPTPTQFGPAWDQALGAWLPSFGEAASVWRDGHATRIEQRDGFAYKTKSHGPWVDALGFQGPYDGTHFIYGEAGPPRVWVVYDYSQHVAFYAQGCCSWQEVVAALDLTLPPNPVIARNLSTLHTKRGIHLGMRAAEVTRIYGASPLLAVHDHKDVKMLAYTTWKPFKEVRGVGAGFPGTCGQFQNFYFRNDQLILIQLGNGC